MKPDELIALLDLGNARAGPTAEPALAVSTEAHLAEEAGSETAFEIDAWGLRRGRDLLDGSERLQRLGLDELTIADCHAAAFDPEPRLVPRCRDALRRKFFASLLETPEYCHLHESTKLDETASEIAAVHFAEELARHQKEAQATSPGDSLGREIAALRSAHRAAETATREVSACRECTMALGLGPGQPGANDPRAVAELFRRVRDDPVLRRICSLAGRYRRLAQSRQRRKTRHGLDDMVGVEFGGDLGHVLPHELVRLATPPFDLEALRRLAERQLMSREYQATEPVGKGPIIVCLDESGSMSGEPIHSAKAIALALAWVARSQGRWAALVAYSGDSGERLLTLPAGRWNEIALAEWLTQFIGCGSTLDVPVREMPRIYADLKAPLGDTDVIFVTDCLCQIPESARDRFNTWKESVRARLITLVIGDEPGDLSQVSDEIHLVRRLDVHEAAVGEILAI